MKRLLLALLLVGCGAPPTEEIADMTPEPEPDLAPAYPVGPYGNGVGDTLPNLQFEGYWSPNASSGKSSGMPFGEIRFDMLHASGKRYAMIMLAGYS